MASLKLKPYSAKVSETKDVSYEIVGLDPRKEYRISLENATHKAKLLSEQIVKDATTTSGKVDLHVPEHSDNAIVSVFANIEEMRLGGWKLAEISAFSFQVENSKARHGSDRVNIYPPFIGPSEQATIRVDSNTPSSTVNVAINGKTFKVRTNHNGYGTMTFRGIDILAGSKEESGVVQKFPVSFSSSSDGHATLFDSGNFVHFIPESMKALQATNDPGVPECAIIDPDPGPGLSLRSLDKLCFEGSVVGPYSIFTSDEFINSHVGYCSELQEVSAAPDCCRIYNSTSTTILPNGAGLVTFSTQSNEAAGECSVPTLASRVYVAHIPTSLKYSGNPVRDVSILKPPQFYHSFYLDSITEDYVIGITFRISDPHDVYEIRHTATSSSVAEFLSGMASAINNDYRNITNRIRAIVIGERIDIYSETRFSIVIETGASAASRICLHSNKTLIVLAPRAAMSDVGRTMLFLTPPLGSQTYDIESRINPDLFRIEIPEGVNNGIGPTIEEDIYCQKIVILDTSVEQADIDRLDSAGVLDINPLPFIKDPEGREVPSVYPVIAARKERVDGQTYVYVICQAPVDGIYQLFYYSFEVGSTNFAPDTWIQLTSEGENKNAKVSCDSAGNLHIVWESDRTGVTQVYYGVLGPGSRAITNQVLMSVAAKESSADLSGSAFVISSPTSFPDSVLAGWNGLYTGSAVLTYNSDSDLDIEINPAEDGGIFVQHLSEDDDGVAFDGKFAQMSYQISFDLNVSGISTTPLDDKDIDGLFESWKSANFAPFNNYQYLYDRNIMTIDRYDLYFDKIIPIAGSYKFEGMPIAPLSNFETEAIAAHGATIRHFVLALMPEKYRFKAVNTEPLFAYCERNELSISECDGYTEKLETVAYTGRYKLALILATSENESTGAIAKKKFHVLRMIGDYIDFSETRNFKIAVHYGKMGSDFIEWKQRLDTSAYEQDYRFYGDIILAVDDMVVGGESFVADFADQYRFLDLGLGVPSGGGFLTNETLPYNGNLYDDVSITLDYNNIYIGNHSIATNDAFISLSSQDRSTTQFITVDGNDYNLFSNGSFEQTTLPLQTSQEIDIGGTGLTGWTVSGPVTYYFTPPGQQTTSNGTTDGSRWIKLSTNNSGGDNYGSIEQTLNLTMGQQYILSFDMSNEPTTTGGGSLSRIIRVRINGVPTNFTITTDSSAAQPTHWSNHKVAFTASVTSTLFEFINVSSSATHGPLIDNIRLILASDNNDELASPTTASTLGLSDDEYNLNYSLGVSQQFTQLPITLSTSDQNRNPSLYVDTFDKPHVVWQSNRNDEWNVFYSGARDRSLPFRFETQITASRGNSIMPSIAVDDKGRRLIAWQDARYGGNYQIFAATSKTYDPQWVDPCKADESKAYVWKINDAEQAYDPYFGYDPYFETTEELGCRVVFDFTAPSDAAYHFMITFYSDSDKVNVVRTISTKSSIVGWRANDTQIPYSGLSMLTGETATITYTLAREDDLVGQVYYVTVQTISATDAVVFDAGSTNFLELSSEPGLNVSVGSANQSDVHMFGFVEYIGGSPIAFSSQTAASIRETGATHSGATFEGDLVELPGVEAGATIGVCYLVFDRSSSTTGTISTVIKFRDPIVRVVWSDTELQSTHDYFSAPGVTYTTSSGDIGIEPGLAFQSNPSMYEMVTVSEDRKTLTLDLSIAANGFDCLRVITRPDTTDAVSNENFVFYCPFEQESKCNVGVVYSNNDQADRNVHFRVTFFADPEYKSVILSSFSLTDTRGWIADTDGFPAAGVFVGAGDNVSVSYDPEVLPFEFYDAQNTVAGTDKQSLICGVTYYVRIESFYAQSFHVESESSFVCPCSYTDPQIYNRNSDEKAWISSAFGKQDFRITNTESQSLKPSVVCGNNGLFYMVWEDYRYTGAIEGQPSMSPDYFMALWVPDDDKFYCSGQGDFDRRITTYTGDGVLHDAAVLIDPFQNISTTFHDSTRIFSKSCSLGCVLEAYNPELIEPCMFTDSTRHADFYVVGTDPDRDTAAYMLMRIRDTYVKYSTYIDLETPMPVVDDCFLELDIIGVPGTYAYRLRNEDDDDWTEWLPINDDLPAQPSDTDSTETERNFFKAYFIAKDRFVAPWITSPGNGHKRVCCEILTFFGKTESFCLDFMAVYKDMEYTIDLFFPDGEPVPKYNSYPVVSTKETSTSLTTNDLRSILDEDSNLTSVSEITAIINIKDKDKLALIKKMRELERFSHLGEITMSVYQQGLNDQLNIPLSDGEEPGTLEGKFSVAKHDGVVNIDGLSVIVVNIPGQCKPYTNEEVLGRLVRLQEPKHLEQVTSIFDNATVFRDLYNADDLRRSFGDVDYYRRRSFGGGIVGGGVGTGGLGTGGSSGSGGSGGGVFGGGSGGGGGGSSGGSGGGGTWGGGGNSTGTGSSGSGNSGGGTTGGGTTGGGTTGGGTTGGGTTGGGTSS